MSHLALCVLSDASAQIDGRPMRLAMLKFICEEDLLAVASASKAFNQSIARWREVVTLEEAAHVILEWHRQGGVAS